MKPTRVLFIFMLLVAVTGGAETRNPAPDVSGKLSVSPEDLQSGIFMREVKAQIEFGASSGTADVLIKTLRSIRSQPTDALRIEIWRSETPPILGETVSVGVLGYKDLPFVLGANETRSDVTTGTIPLTTPLPRNYYLTVAILEMYMGEYLYADFYTLPGVRFIGPRIGFSRMPNGLVQLANTGGATDRIEFANVGTIDGNVSLSIVGGFFSISPSSFTLEPKKRQRVTITAVPQPEGFYQGEVIVNISRGVFSVPVSLLSADPPDGSIRVKSETRRVDVAGKEGAPPSGVIRFTNEGTSTLKGFAVSSSPWILPLAGLIEIPPGESALVGFRCIRELRNDSTALSVVGTLSLKYLVGRADQAKTTFDSPPTSLAGVVVTDTTNPETTSSTVPPLGENEVSIVVPGVGHVTGSGGKEFISDLSLVNSIDGLSIGDLNMYYSSASVSKGSPQTSIAAGGSVNLADVVTSYFGETDQVGTLHLRSSSTDNLGVSANVFNKSNLAGTYGTALPAFRSDRSASKGESVFITGLVQTSTAHTNLYVQEMSGNGSASVTIDFFDENGATVGSLTPAPASAFGLLQMTSVVPLGAVSARVNVTSDTGSIAAYATPVDDSSGDTWAVADWSRQANLSGSDRKIIPVAGAAPGANNTNFKTDVSLTNIGSSQGQVSLTYYPSGGAPISKTVTLGAMQSSTLSDVVPTFFEVSGTSVGWISVDPVSGSWEVSSRTYTQQEGDPATFGTGVATLGAGNSLSSGEYRVFGGLEDTTLDTINSGRGATFRTNLGLVEVSGNSAKVSVSVSFADGNDLVAGGSDGTMEIDLVPNGFVQLSGVVRSVLGEERDTEYGDLHGVQVRVQVVSGEGSVIPYVTSTDNGTGDTVLRTE